MEYFGGEAMNLNKIFRGAQGNITFSQNLQGQAHTLWGVNSWGGRVLNKYLYGEGPPRGSTPLPFNIPFFHEKGTDFYVSSIDKRYLFHIPCLELCNPLNCCKCNVF